MACGQVEGDRGEVGAWNPEAMGAMASSSTCRSMQRKLGLHQALAVALWLLRADVLQGACGCAPAGRSASVQKMRPRHEAHEAAIGLRRHEAPRHEAPAMKRSRAAQFARSRGVQFARSRGAQFARSRGS